MAYREDFQNLTPTDWSVLACIVLVLHTYWIIICANTDWIHATIQATINAKYRGHVLFCIVLQYIPILTRMACIVLVFVMHEIMIRANTDQMHAYFFNMCQCWCQYIHQYDPNTIQYRPIQAQIQTKTSINTDEYTEHCFQCLHQYMPIQASVLSDQAPPPAPPVPATVPPAQPAS